MTFKWFTKFRHEHEQSHDVEHGTIEVNEDGSLHVEVDDDYYSGEIDALTARRLAEEIMKPQSVAIDVGYAAYVANPSDTRQAKERGLYPENQDLRIDWDGGWLQAQIEDELGIDVKKYAEVGGAGMGMIQDAIRKLKTGVRR